MKITEITESVELCTEAGWEAYDISVDGVINRDIIIQLGELGSMTYLSGLKQPFYRIEEQFYMIKGLEGKSQLRVSMYKGMDDILSRVRAVIEDSAKE